ncbi:MAG: fibrillin [Merismopedia sp. SIO2A8]|nr:fibrillin [Symploca sp. SIO2B6]NET53761.1 fibrillin [Merismopedia sp. SIO2A8]
MTTAKATVLEAIAGRNRGLLADEHTNGRILKAIATLEAQAPIAEPLAATDMLMGVWRLLYTTSDELLGINRLPFYALNQIYQCIDVKASKIYNIAEVTGIPGLGGLVSVAATFEAVSQKRVEVTFNRAIFGLQRALSYRTPEQFIDQMEATQRFFAIDIRLPAGNQQGWLDITYLDDTLRIGRGNQGSVFVLTKVDVNDD